MSSTQALNALNVSNSADNRMVHEKMQMSYQDQENKENISENLSVEDADLIAKPTCSNACSPSCGDDLPAVPEDCDDTIPLEHSLTMSTPLRSALPSSGTTDDLEKLVEEAAPLAPMMAAPQNSNSDMVAAGDGATEAGFRLDETACIFDWDDTVLPSTWVQRQGLTLDDSTTVTAAQREQLDEVARVSAETIRLAMQFGEVVFVTNAEHGWVPLSCQKFMPTLYPLIEGIRVLSARTTYETPQCRSPLEWKVRAFESEIARLYGEKELHDGMIRKNVLSLGDSVHEREALLRATAPLPNCRSKSLKFVERPDIAQLLKQHSLVTSCFNQIVDHDGNLDLLIRCN